MAKYNQSKNFAFNGKLIVKDLKIEKPTDDLSKLSLLVTDGNSSQFVQVSQWHMGKNFKALEKVGDKYELFDVKYEERFNDEVIERVANFTKYKLALPKDKLTQEHKDFWSKRIKDFDKKDTVYMEFIYAGDFMNFLATYIKNGVLKDVELYMSGQIKFGEYTNYDLKFVSLSKEETKSLQATMSLVYGKGACVDKVEDKMLEINGWVYEKIKEKGMAEAEMTMLSQKMYLDYGKLPNGDAIKNFIMNKMNVIEDNKYYASCFIVDLFKGSDDVVVPLSDTQKEMIAIGFMTEEQAIADNTVKGDKKTLTRIIRPVTNETYSEFRMLTDFTDKDFGLASDDEMESLFGGFAPNGGSTEFFGELPL